ncbi:MAG: acyl-CoA dehydratase activase, partial [Bacillota bacterium]
MRRAGVDIGSRTIAVVVMEEGKIIYSTVVDTGYQPNETAAALLTPFAAPVVATGYGRHAAKASFAREIITEIKAHALGAAYLFPEVRTILDIGGQDTKAILLSPQKAVVDFVMNDKCSAGTGKFLEVMAAALGYDIGEIGPAALAGKPGLKISNMCTVFAESEAISLLHRGTPRQDIALALHQSVA